MNTFKIKSGKLHVTDPCYDADTNCGLYNLPAQNGEWEGEVERLDKKDWGMRVGELVVHHKDHFTEVHSGSWEELEGEVGVDSGQAGVFDSEIYPKGENDGEANDMSSFYGRACRETCPEFDRTHAKEKESKGLSLDCGVVDDGGFVSCSGYGDGGYTAYGVKNSKNELIAVKIVFIDDEDEEDEDY